MSWVSSLSSDSELASTLIFDSDFYAIDVSHSLLVCEYLWWFQQSTNLLFPFFPFFSTWLLSLRKFTYYYRLTMRGIEREESYGDDVTSGLDNQSITPSENEAKPLRLCRWKSLKREKKGKRHTLLFLSSLLLARDFTFSCLLFNFNSLGDKFVNFAAAALVPCTCLARNILSSTHFCVRLFYFSLFLHDFLVPGAP